MPGDLVQYGCIGTARCLGVLARCEGGWKQDYGATLYRTREANVYVHACSLG
jgi:hypothetical protein